MGHLQTLQARRRFQALVLLYECMNGRGPSYLSERFTVLNVDYDLRGGGSPLRGSYTKKTSFFAKQLCRTVLTLR